MACIEKGHHATQAFMVYWIYVFVRAAYLAIPSIVWAGGNLEWKVVLSQKGAHRHRGEGDFFRQSFAGDPKAKPRVPGRV